MKDENEHFLYVHYVVAQLGFTKNPSSPFKVNARPSTMSTHFSMVVSKVEEEEGRGDFCRRFFLLLWFVPLLTEAHAGKITGAVLVETNGLFLGDIILVLEQRVLELVKHLLQKRESPM